MSVTIEVNSDTARKLRSIAESKGISVDDLLHAYVPGLTANGSSPEMSAGERAKAFREWAESHRRDLPLLSDDAVSRKSFYER